MRFSKKTHKYGVNLNLNTTFSLRLSKNRQHTFSTNAKTKKDSKEWEERGSKMQRNVGGESIGAVLSVCTVRFTAYCIGLYHNECLSKIVMFNKGNIARR